MSAGLAAVAAQISAHLGRRVSAEQIRPVAGGCINEAWRLRGKGGDVFVKTNRSESLAMFEAEAEGLDELGKAEALRVPAVLGTGVSGNLAWLALEHVETGTARTDTERELGAGLARQHGHTGQHFGWHRDNTIGLTTQLNQAGDDWPEFFATRRLGFQLDLAGDDGRPASLVDAGRRLQEVLGCFFADELPAPALLHGDLWGGNWAVDDHGAPFVFDPAVYYGDPLADIAMTRLFGGFSGDFYAAYEERRPPITGAGLRCELYNLYHVLNHLHLFGQSYQSRAEQMIKSLLAEAA
jgi:protein-ribulosamine 3-kinase